MSELENANELGVFLRLRRATIHPRDAGLRPSWEQRRVPGLRREEVSELAGVSVPYYTRLEQGGAGQVSPQVLDALAAALQLTDVERAHLHDLAQLAAPPGRWESEAFEVTPESRMLLDAMQDVPALLMARNQDVLAWNALGHAVTAPFTDPEIIPSRGRPNLLRLLFCDASVRRMYLDWEAEATRAVASLRFVAAQFPDAAEVIHTINTLRADSEEFNTLWREYPVDLCAQGIKNLDHPEVGLLQVSFQVLHLPSRNGQRVMTYLAEPGSSDADALTLLANLHSER